MSSSATRRGERAFEQFADGVRDALGDHIHEIVLYGSVARGEATEHSDVDVLVVLDSENREERLACRETVMRLAFDVGLEYDIVLEPHLQTRSRFDARRDHPFLKNVLREGHFYG